MTGQMRQQLIEHLWRDYSRSTRHVKLIEKHLSAKQITPPNLDHFAIIDLPGPHTGMTELIRLFTAIGYEFRGTDYLPDKQNDFTWMAAADSSGHPAAQALPQIVVADFRLDELPATVRKIIHTYSKQAAPSPITDIIAMAARRDTTDIPALLQRMTTYLSGRDWPLPTIKEFQLVREHNELLAWVLVFGRRPNHFTYSIHLMSAFNSLNEFHQFIENDVGLSLNQDGGAIKGSRASGIEQGSTAGTPERVTLADGIIELPMGFVEFVWRFPEKEQPLLWEDYFTGFVANHANQVIQSLYVDA
jgi:hypothetical protein